MLGMVAAVGGAVAIMYYYNTLRKPNPDNVMKTANLYEQKRI